MNAPFEAGRFGSGQAVRRIEDPALVQGQGRYTDDVAPHGQVFLAFARSQVAHGRIVAVGGSPNTAASTYLNTVATYTPLTNTWR